MDIVVVVVVAVVMGLERGVEGKGCASEPCANGGGNVAITVVWRVYCKSKGNMVAQLYCFVSTI